jgi:hypothetical protein
LRIKGNDGAWAVGATDAVTMSASPGGGGDGGDGGDGDGAGRAERGRGRRAQHPIATALPWVRLASLASRASLKDQRNVAAFIGLKVLSGYDSHPCARAYATIWQPSCPPCQSPIVTERLDQQLRFCGATCPQLAQDKIMKLREEIVRRSSLFLDGLALHRGGQVRSLQTALS